jgi:hypothetical protein
VIEQIKRNAMLIKPVLKVNNRFQNEIEYLEAKKVTAHKTISNGTSF